MLRATEFEPCMMCFTRFGGGLGNRLALTILVVLELHVGGLHAGGLHVGGLDVGGQAALYSLADLGSTASRMMRVEY
ncbi:hypothetical protein B0T11DRAFT_282836 [Plectosphaerella cucumerina]|uniref:Uncharacterized protein n=1 Tax=Plectosphaerella cucumerina TaxID=40658 RepID=A0A8K0X4B5_9PEZI|nr:hypothetical protein B0T11DRAFT_282836 [Plectosphaerella cucumerina]